MPRSVAARRRALLKKSVTPVDVTNGGRVSGTCSTSSGRRSIQARNLGRALEVWENALTDAKRPDDPARPLRAAHRRRTPQGPPGPGRLGARRCGRDDRRGACTRTSTRPSGAATGSGPRRANDVELRELYLDRIYDTYVDELKFEDTDRAIGRITESVPAAPGLLPGVLPVPRGAVRRPRFDPRDRRPAAACRSSRRRSSTARSGSGSRSTTRGTGSGQDRFILDAIRDNYELVQILAHSPRTAVVYIGGGTPKNWINDGIVMANYAFGREGEGHYYALQITTDVPHWGGLSGSTLDEAQSWGKISKTATRAMAHLDASIGLPLLAGALWDRRAKWQPRTRLRFDWTGDEVTIGRSRDRRSK